MNGLLKKPRHPDCKLSKNGLGRREFLRVTGAGSLGLLARGWPKRAMAATVDDVFELKVRGAGVTFRGGQPQVVLLTNSEASPLTLRPQAAAVVTNCAPIRRPPSNANPRTTRTPRSRWRRISPKRISSSRCRSHSTCFKPADTVTSLPVASGRHCFSTGLRKPCPKNLFNENQISDNAPIDVTKWHGFRRTGGK